LTPQARAYLDKARNDLEDAAKIAAIGLAQAAARSAYYAAFHAAEALIAERSGKVAMHAELKNFTPRDGLHRVIARSTRCAIINE
jgi:uncharacterized protein (UPF0332 family)